MLRASETSRWCVAFARPRVTGLKPSEGLRWAWASKILHSHLAAAGDVEFFDRVRYPDLSGSRTENDQLAQPWIKIVLQNRWAWLPQIQVWTTPERPRAHDSQLFSIRYLLNNARDMSHAELAQGVGAVAA